MASSYKTLNTFTKDMCELKIHLSGITEISGITRGFSIMNADMIEFKYDKESKSQSLGIFLYKNGELIAKDFVFFFKDNDEIILEQMILDGKETHWYGLKYLES
jgi:hypothetical protein